MSFLDQTATITLTAPSSVDGRGEVAIINGDPTAGNFVGYLLDASGGPNTRESAEDRPSAHGGVHGDFYHGRFEFSLDVMLARASSWANSFARRDKLYRAANAMHDDGTMTWTDSGGVAKRLLYRRQQRPAGPDKEGKVVLTFVSEDYAILSNVETTPTAPTSGMTPVGNVGSRPRFTFTTGAAGTIIISRTTPSPTESITLNVGGTTGLATSTATIVDFADRSITQGGTDKRSALVWPATWWEMVPGVANTLSITGTSTATSKLVSWRSAWTV